MTARARPEPQARGQAAPLMVVMLLVLTVAVVATVEIGQLLDESARARTAADAAALAGAAAGRQEAAAWPPLTVGCCSPTPNRRRPATSMPCW